MTFCVADYTSWFVKMLNEIQTAGIRAQAKVNIEPTRVKMNQARDVFVQRRIEVSGSSQ